MKVPNMSRTVKQSQHDEKFTMSSQRSRKKTEDDKKEKDEQVLLRRKIRDIKPWQPGTFRLDKEVKLGTRMKGEIERRPDRPYSEISLSNNSKWDRFDEFDSKYERDKNYVKNRLKYVNNQWKVASMKNDSIVSRSILPSHRKRVHTHQSNSQATGSNTRSSNQPKIKACKPKKRFLELKKQAQRLCSATKRL